MNDPASSASPARLGPLRCSPSTGPPLAAAYSDGVIVLWNYGLISLEQLGSLFDWIAETGV
jgi:Protein of unknown function (DUF2949)